MSGKRSTFWVNRFDLSINGSIARLGISNVNFIGFVCNEGNKFIELSLSNYKMCLI